MNYLQLVQDLFAESRAAGSAPTTVAGLTGLNADFARWIKDAWNELSGERDDWLFKLKDISFSTASLASSYSAGTAPLSALDDLHEWVPFSFRYYITAEGQKSEQFMGWMQYPDFRDYYLFGNRRIDVGPPLAACSTPDKSLLIGPVPDKDYTIVGQYVSFQSELAADGDTPVMPARFHKLIVYKALEQYGIDAESPSALAKAERGKMRLKLQLARHQLEKVTTSPPMA